MLNQSSNMLWMKRLFSVITPSVTSGVGAGFRCNLDIQVLSHPNPQASTGAAATQAQATTAYDQHTSLRFKVYNAWISSLSYSNLDAGSNTLMVEEMSLVHEGFDVAYAKDYTLANTAKEIS
jgi:phage tail-like protein